MQLSTVLRLKNDYFVQLLGYCLESNNRILVYKFATKGSLHDILHERKGVQGVEPGPVLSWGQRLKIAYGAVRGLEYLHEKVQPPIVHRKVSIMKMLEHRNIINLKEVIDDPESDHFYMVLEYVDGKWICDASGTCGGIEESISRRYLRDIISGLMYLHAHDIVHGDIKPENLLVTKSGIVKIGDFSVSHAFEDGDDVLGRSPGTPVFTAPECCLGPTYHGKAADVWAVGVTLYCMALGHCPYIGDSLQDTYDQIINKSLYLPAEMDPELKDLLKGLLCKDPRQRLTLEAAADHPWVVREEGPIRQTSCRCKSSDVPEEE